MDLFTAVIVFMWIVYIWESYLSKRQHRIYETVKEVPSELTSVIDQKTFEKSRLYAIDKSNFGFWKGLYSQVETTLILYFGAIPFLWTLSGTILVKCGIDPGREIIRSIAFALIGNIFSLVTGLPWDLYGTFVLEEKHGFNKMTLGFYFKDMIKKMIVSEAITIPLISLIIYIVQVGGDYFYIYAWLTVFVISMCLMYIYPEYIAPLFDKYTPLPDGDLKTKIEELAASVKFPLTKLYIVEGSKRSSHSNAYMYGFHKNKRIVLFDTLVEEYAPGNKKETDSTQEENTEDVAKGDEDVPQKVEKSNEEEPKEPKKIGCNNEEVVAVLGHELGHWKFSHMVWNILIMQISIFTMFFIFGKLMILPSIFEAFGFDESMQPVLIKLFVVFSLILSPLNEVESFLMNVLSRKFEFQADEFAVNLGKRDFLKTALLKLFKDNLSFPVADWLYSTRHYSHPPLLERLRGMDVVKMKNQ